VVVVLVVLVKQAVVGAGAATTAAAVENKQSRVVAAGRFLVYGPWRNRRYAPAGCAQWQRAGGY